MTTRGIVAALLLLASPAGAQPIPQLGRWQAQMLSAGQVQCDFLKTGASFDSKLQNIYYDAQRVFLQIGDFTGSPAAWTACALAARAVYRDQYVMGAACWPSGWGCVPGYWNFTHGLTLDFLKTGDAASKNAVINLSKNAAYSTDADWNASDTASAWRSRELAYALMGHLNAEKVGATPRTTTPLIAAKNLAYMDQWFGSKSFRCPSICDPSAAVGQYYIQPFMVGLTAQALIMWHDKTADPKVLPAIKQAADWLWANAWVQADQAFWYENWTSDPASPMPAKPGSADLNMLIAPAFAWLYTQTNDPTYLTRGDQIFAGGVTGAFLGGGKQFDQNYMWSFDYVKWRTAQAPPLLTATGTVTIPAVTGAGITPSMLSFPAQAVGTTSEPQDVTISNPTTGDWHYEPSVSGPFAITANGCAAISGWDGYVNPTALNPLNVCVVSVTFTPLVAGAVGGTLTVVANPRTGGPAPPLPPTFSGTCRWTYVAANANPMSLSCP